MEVKLQDTIERELVLRAPIERVYASIADPAEIVKWFPDGVEGKFDPGERPIFDFGTYGRFAVYIVAAEPHRHFAYRWIPGGKYVPDGFLGDVLSEPNTLVEFFLDEVPDGTRLRLRESGFAALSAEDNAQALKDNNEGWDAMLARLDKLMASARG